MSGPTYVIAEAGVNHNGSLERALELVSVAKRCGADAVKFQTFQAKKLASCRAKKAAYQEKTTGAEGGQVAMLEALELSHDDHRALLAQCRDEGIDFLSTPFDRDSLDFLVGQLDMQRIKIGSGDLTNGPLLLAAGRWQRPVVLSTGMSTLEEVAQAIALLAFAWTAEAEERPGPGALAAALESEENRPLLARRLCVLQCTTEYPAPFAEVNLRAMDTMQEAFGLPVGFSDHTPGIAIPIAAVARGATLIEKHFTLDKTLPGPDHCASLEPAELAAMVDGIRQAEVALGDGVKRPGPSELPNRVVARRSLVALRDICAGEPFVEENLGCKRPGGGLSPMDYWAVLGRIAPRDFAEDEAIEL